MRIIELKETERKFNINNTIYAVVGSDNPSGSIKDITAYFMLKNINGDLKGKTIIEATSGNTGISLAYYQKEFGYNAIIVMPSSMSLERRMMIERYGAKLCLVDGGMAECEEKADELLKEIDNSVIFGQFESKYNPLAHYNITGPEIHKAIGDVDYLFAGIGTGGTITGTSMFLKQKCNTCAIGIEPLESPLLSKGFASSHQIQGIGANFIPKTLDMKYVDKVQCVKGIDAIEYAKIINEIEHISVGISSGAALKGALDYVLENNISGKKLLVIFPDGGDRYKW